MILGVKLKSLLTVLTPVVAFALTLVLNWPPGENLALTSATPAVPRETSASRTDAPKPPPIPALAASAPATAPAASLRPSGDPVVPLRLFVRPAIGETKALATMMNLSTDSLQARIEATNSRTHLHSVVDVSLQPHQRVNLTAAGLDVSPGDEVSIDSPPYAKLTVRAQ